MNTPAEYREWPRLKAVSSDAAFAEYVSDLVFPFHLREAERFVNQHGSALVLGASGLRPGRPWQPATQPPARPPRPFDRLRDRGELRQVLFAFDLLASLVEDAKRHPERSKES